MEGTITGIALAEARTDIVVTKSALMEGIAAAEGMMMMMVKSGAGAEDTGALVLASGEDGVGAEAEVPVERDREGTVGKGVRKDVPKLRNGIGRKKSRKLQGRAVKELITG